MSMKIMEKLKGVLTPEDLAELETGIKAVVNEDVQNKVALLVEEKTKELEAASAKYVTEAVEEKRKEIIAEYDKKMEKLEETLIENVDQFLASEIQTEISDAAITKVAVNECLVPIVDGIRKVFSENFVEMDSSADKKLKELTEKVEELSTQTSQLIAEKMDLSSKLDKRDVTDLIAQKSAGLKTEQAARVKAMFENETIDNVKSKIDGFVNILVESENKAPVVKPNKVNDGAATPAPAQAPRKPMNEETLDAGLAAAVSMME
jgi:hypothetical protein